MSIMTKTEFNSVWTSANAFVAKIQLALPDQNRSGWIFPAKVVTLLSSIPDSLRGYEKFLVLFKNLLKMAGFLALMKNRSQLF